MFTPGDLAVPEPPPDPATFQPPQPAGVRSRLPGAKAKYQAEWEQGRLDFERAAAEHQIRETTRQRRLAKARVEYEQAVANTEKKLREQHEEIEAFQAAFGAGEPHAVIRYFALVLEASSYPEDFPQRFRIAYVPESRQLVTEYELPSYDQIPAVAKYRYVRAGDKITEVARPASERRNLYESTVAQVTVRTIHELFEADRSGIVETVVLNGHVETINAATGGRNDPAW